VTSSRISPERMRKIRVFQEDAYLSLDYEKQAARFIAESREKLPAQSSDRTRGNR